MIVSGEAPCLPPLHRAAISWAAALLVGLVVGACGGDAPGTSTSTGGASTSTCKAPFGDDGMVTGLKAGEFYERSSAIAALPDGRVLVLGAFFPTSAYKLSIAVYRLLPSGELDGSFGEGGVTTIPADGIGSTSNAFVALQDGGAIVVVTDADTTHRVRLVKVDGAGAIDPGYGQGHVEIIPAYVAPTTGPVLLADGRVVVGVQGRLQWFDAAGAPEGEPVAGDAKIRIDHIASTPTGAILVAGTDEAAPVGAQKAAFARVLPDGTLDAAFGSAGRALVEVPPQGDDRVRLLASDAAGGVVAVVDNDAESGAGPSAMLPVRLTPEGALDASFSFDRTALRDDEPLFTGLAALPDGKVVLGGNVSPGNQALGFSLVRLEAGGGLDPTFGDGGIASRHTELFPAGRSGLVEGLALRGDEVLLVTGERALSNRTPDPEEIAVLRFCSDGTTSP